MYLDAWFLSTTSKTSPISSSDLRLTYPSMAGAINETRSIKTEQDEVDLLAEMNDIDLPMKLMESHEYTRKIFTSSGVRLHEIISLQIVIQKEPFFWVDAEE
jgi:hypothetical protein